MKNKKLSVAFIFNKPIRIPLNNREYYISIELLRRNHNVIWFCEKHADNYSFSEKITQIFIRHKPQSKIKIFLYLFYLTYILIENKIKYVWLSGWNDRRPLYLLLFCIILKIIGIKTIYDTIDPIYEFRCAFNTNISIFKKRKMRFLMSFIYKISTLNLTVTEELKDALIKKGAPSRKIHVAYWGVDTERFSPSKIKSDFREKYNLQNKFVIGWLGHMDSFRCIEEIIIPLITMLPSLIREVFFLIGGKGELEDSLLSLQKKYHLPLLMLGSINYDLAPAFTASIDLYIVPINTTSELGRSIRPVKMFDALAMGIPVVVSASPCTLKLSHTFKSIQYANHNLNGFLNAILNVYKEYREIKKLAMIEIDKVVKYSHQRVSEGIADLLERKI